MLVPGHAEREQEGSLSYCFLYFNSAENFGTASGAYGVIRTWGIIPMSICEQYSCTMCSQNYLGGQIAASGVCELCGAVGSLEMNRIAVPVAQEAGQDGLARVRSQSRAQAVTSRGSQASTLASRPEG